MGCVHSYARQKRWSAAYECLFCGLVTRRYDYIDALACRPVHLEMSVALRRYNIASGRQQRSWRKARSNDQVRSIPRMVFDVAELNCDECIHGTDGTGKRRCLAHSSSAGGEYEHNRKIR